MAVVGWIRGYGYEPVAFCFEQALSDLYGYALLEIKMLVVGCVEVEFSYQTLVGMTFQASQDPYDSTDRRSQRISSRGSHFLS